MHTLVDRTKSRKQYH